MESSRSNRLRRFGEHMPTLLNAIEEAHRKGQFKHRPRGPLGKIHCAIMSLIYILYIKKLHHTSHSNYFKETIYTFILQQGQLYLTTPVTQNNHWTLSASSNPCLDIHGGRDLSLSKHSRKSSSKSLFSHSLRIRQAEFIVDYLKAVQCYSHVDPLPSILQVTLLAWRTQRQL